MELTCPICKKNLLKKLNIYGVDIGHFVCTSCMEQVFIPSSNLGTIVIKTLGECRIPSPLIPKFIEGILAPTELNRCN